MSVRKITNNNRRNRIGKFPSIKMGKMIKWESLIERDYIYLLEWDRDVLDYIEQPLTICCSADDEILHYTPDFWVRRINGTDIVEIKSSRLVYTPEALLQKEIGLGYCQKAGINYSVITDEDIRKGHFLRNIKLLFKYSRVKMPFYSFNKICNLINKKGTLTIGDLNRYLQHSDGYGDYLPLIYHLIFSKNIYIDLHEPLSSNSIIQGVVFN